jgi:hypothetical protein
MTAQEQQMIQSLADRINNTPLAEKDPEAEQFLQQALGRNRDALYILAQTTLVQQYALEQAQKQLADARNELDQQRQQAQQPKHATSFLGNLLGLHDDPTPPQAAQAQYAPVQEYGQPGYGAPSRGYTPGGSSFSGPGSGPPPPPYGQPQYSQPPYGQPQYGQPQSGGFLRSAMQTATGVAAGALAFEGIESLMHGFGGGGNSFGSGMGGGRPEEIINNNYYGDSASGEHKERSSDFSSDVEDRRHEPTAFEDAVDRDDHGKAGFLDTADASTDDASFDDDSNVDNSSSDFDDSGDYGSDNNDDTNS